VSQLEAQNQKLNTPLSAGALQLQDLLMTRVGETDTTFKDMLQFCFKDITRDYPIEDDEESFLSDTDENDRNDGNDACFGVFEMSPVARGLPYDNEHITEQVG
jgi:glutaminase